MATYIRSFLLFVVSTSLSLGVVASAAAIDGNIESACGFTIELPSGMSLKKDADVQLPLCSYRDSSGSPTPFVNSVVVLSWSNLGTVRVNNQPLQDINFFRLSPGRTATYLGRPSYSDPRNAYGQRVVKKSLRRSKASGDAKSLIARSELIVKWLKPVEQTIQEEVSEAFVCVDAAVSDGSSVALVNWCLPKTDTNAQRLEKTAQSLRLRP